MPISARKGLRSSLALAVAVALTLASARARGQTPALTPPERIESSAVPYPALGKGDATVILVIVVDAEGGVRDVTVQEGAPPFAEAAVAVARTWRFAPAKRGDVPVAARIRAAVDFRAPPPPPRTAEPARAPVTAAPSPVKAAPLEAQVRGEREELGTNHIPRSEARFIPGAFGDPVRAVEALPGMAPWLSGLPYYYVRGSPPENVGYTIDGIRVPLLFHVGAGPSTIAPALIDSVDLYAGAYPARHGRYAGAIIAGTTAPPEPERTRAEFGVRLFDANAFGETGFDDGKGSVMIAGRYGYTGLITSLIAPDYTVDYWDYQARVTHRVGGRDTVSLLVFGAHDELAFKSHPTFHIEYHRADLRYDHPLSGGNLRIGATASFDDTLTALQTDTGAGARAALRGPGGRLRAELEQRLTPEVLLRAGADFGATHFDTDEYGSDVRGPHTDLQGTVYADVLWRPSRALELVPGFRVDAYATPEDKTVAPQPRLAAKFRLTDRVSAISAFGVAHQERTEEVFVPSRLPDATGGVPRDSYQFSQALEVRLPASLRLRTTAFYSRLLAPETHAEQRSEGLEVFVRRDFTERLGGFVSYTLSRTDSTRRETTGLAEWNRTHLFSTVLGYDLGRGFRAGARFFVESGRPYQYFGCTSPGCAPGPAGTGPYGTWGLLPPFYRLDVRFEKRWTFASGRFLQGSIECFNALYQFEPTGVEYSPRRGLSIYERPPIILPSIGIEGGL